jgi:tetratricopeptide (TPR) repeat protein
LAGPAVNAVLGVSVLLFVPMEHLWSLHRVENSLALGHAFFFSNLFLLVTNLWPHAVAAPIGRISSDGRLLWETLFLKQQRMDEAHGTWFALEGMVCHENGQIAEGLSWFEKGLELYPDNFLLLNLKGNILIEQRQFQAARDCFLSLLARKDISPVPRALMLNNIAYVDALLGEANLLAEGDRYSQEALSALGWVPAVRGTRGTVLLELGRIDEALPLLRESMEQAENSSGKAQNACLISIGEARRGNLAESRKYLDEARKLVPDCFLGERAETALLNASQTPV